MKIRLKKDLGHCKKPKWLATKLPTGSQYQQVRQFVSSNALSTVCQEARCPNQFECYSQGSATFMILGDKCTRNCRFCNVQHGADLPIDLEEPARVAQAISEMKLKYAVITSVTRDDLSDGGASIFVKSIKEIRRLCPNTLIEVLIPDFLGDFTALETVVLAKPDVLNHNVETISRLYSKARPQAIYERSLELLQNVRIIDPHMVIKSGVMVGLGESDEELLTCFADIQNAGCDLLIVGQYLQPTKEHLEVERYVEPSQFEKLREKALAMGFADVMAGPLVRSSYKAEEMYRKVKGELRP